MELGKKPKTNNSLENKRTEFHVTHGIYFARKIKNVKASDRAAAMPGRRVIAARSPASSAPTFSNSASAYVANAIGSSGQEVAQ